MNLLAVNGDATLSVAAVLRACSLFGITENSARVTLARLAQRDLIEAVERGVYSLGPAGKRLGRDVAGWVRAEARLRPWNGQWIAAATGGLPRSDRKRLRSRERALSMLGMRELAQGLFIRPDNLIDDVAKVEKRLLGLGLDEQAIVFAISDLGQGWREAASSLWEGEFPAAVYWERTEKLMHWLEKAPSLSLDIAARESFTLGDEAIRQVVFDPLLPAPLTDETARHAFFQAVREFDAVGKQIWERFLNQISPLDALTK
ncbi:PaaX family transcriptional regulator C-terminal domain-containing protein [Rhizobium sp. L1K21]|uniref:PaaX family transcriptional regulator C-terminal domain-containing protein n=1 Tax=Rhizobium sp. L1K21 TaxID=2954933 RepID=UPI002092FD42|nr:PaaX family transcriptional regulator C-terminal domain-containing protein [Rhizobium sp. L1K21]